MLHQCTHVYIKKENKNQDGCMLYKRINLIKQDNTRLDISVNTNSKYKEDVFTDSDAVDCSQDVCIYFLHEAPTCHPRPFVPSSPLYTSQLGSQSRRVELVTAPTQGAT